MKTKTYYLIILLSMLVAFMVTSCKKEPFEKLDYPEKYLKELKKISPLDRTKELADRNFDPKQLLSILIKLEKADRILFLKYFLPDKEYINTKLGIKGDFSDDEMEFEYYDEKIIKEKGIKDDDGTVPWTVRENTGSFEIKGGPLAGKFDDVEYIVVNNELCLSQNDDDGVYYMIVCSKDPAGMIKKVNAEVEKLYNDTIRIGAGISILEKAVQYPRNKMLYKALLSDEMFTESSKIKDIAKTYKAFNMSFEEDLIKKLKNKKLDDKPRSYIADILGKLESKKALDAYLEVLREKNLDEGLLIYCLFGIGKSNEPKGIEILRQYTKHHDSFIRGKAVLYLSYVKDERAVNLILHSLKHDPVWDVRFNAASALLIVDDKNMIPHLEKAMDTDKHAEVREEAERVLRILRRKYGIR